MTWPSFIAAPFIVPSAATICSAVSSWRLASAFSRPASPRATFVARVPICLAACVAASRPTFDERLRRDVGMASFLATTSVAAFDLRAGDDVVAPVCPANPGLVPAVVVVAPDDERRGLAPDGDLLVALGVQAAPDADEAVVLPLVADRRRVGVAGVDHGRVVQAHERVHDRGLDVGVGRAARRADAADRVLEERVAGEDVPGNGEVQHPLGVAGRVDGVDLQAADLPAARTARRPAARRGGRGSTMPG